MHVYHRRTVRSLAAVLGALLITTSGLAVATIAVSGPEAGATTLPSWEPVADPPQVGGLIFYDATGHQITSGSTTSPPLAAYVQGTNLPRSGDTSATLDAYTPQQGESPGQWPGEALSGTTAFPNASAPSPLSTSPLPLVTGASGDYSLANYISDFPNTLTNSDAGLYVLRLFTVAPGHGVSTSYDAADILISGTTWSVVYTDAPTTTTLGVSPASPQPFGTSVTLTATVTAGAAGTVQFSSGSTALGAPQTVSGGTASLVTTALPVGTDNLSAVFSATGTGYAGSTGTATYTVTAIPTTTTLGVSPISPQPSGTSETLTATVSPSASGTVQFKDGTSALGSPVTVSGGVATYVTSTLPVGSNSLSAVFTPTTGNGYAGSTGTATFVVTAVATTTTLGVSPISPQSSGTSETLTATVSPAASGTVQFENGTNPLGSPVTVSGGVATYVTAQLPVGSLTLNAVYTPTAGNGYAGSTGTAAFVVTAAPTTTTLGVSPASPQPFGTSVTLTATVSPSATGTVQFENGTSALGSPVTVSGGVATSVTTQLPVGSNSLSAVFSPTNGNGYAGSTGTATFVVTAIPTTTTLTASPVSPQPQLTSITLSATVSPAASGTVQFENGTNPLGSPVTVSGGVATYQTTALPVGSDALSAVFTPTSGNGYAASTGTTTFDVTTQTTTTLGVAPTSPRQFGTSLTLTATVSPTAAGTVQFEDGTADLGSPVTVTGGVATYQTSTLPVGTDALSAVFTPSSPASYAGSTGTTTFTVTSIPTSTTLTPSPAGPQVSGTPVTLTAAVSPAAPGTVQFEFGSTPLGLPVTVNAGTAAVTTSSLPVGTDALSAVFTPSTGSGYTGSTGTATFTVEPLTATSTTLDASPTSPQVVGTPVTLTATVTAGAPGTVQFEVGSTPLGSPVPVSGGTASLTTSSLPAGTDTLGAVFTPTPGSGYAGSTGTTTFTVDGRSGKGYWLVAADGGIFAFGNAGFYGSTGGLALNKPIVGMAATPDAKGYWLVASDGGIFSGGDAGYFGSTGSLPLNKPIVGLAATPTGKGYWLVAADGGIFAFGDAGFYGSTGSLALNKPIVGIAATPDGKGYWLVAADGGIFAFGDAGFYGSTGSLTLNKPIVGIATTPDGNGYWLVAADGGIFAFGDAGFHGSTGSLSLVEPIVGAEASPDGQGYLLVAANGGIFAFGDAAFYGSGGGAPLAKPIVGLAGS